ncbi:MAG: peptidase S10 [Beijerinckiaceae bacterium]|nr:MAG: peptidase S10 [Beijerinckiaceae bacterium]
MNEASDKKDIQTAEHQPPAGARTSLSWTSADGRVEQVEAASEWIVIRKREKPAAEIFHTYYRLADVPEPRPVTFVFNGGPGAASAYLHIGGLGPQRVQFEAQGHVPPPPVRLTNNPESWIAFTDLVFVDPVGTGFSRIVEQEPKPADKEKPEPGKGVDEKEFFGLNRDLESLGEFIERFLSKHKLWNAPVFIAGESYGGFRTAKLARRLQEKHGIGLTAAIAISPALEWTLLNESDYDVPRYVDTFCVMALAAAFHKRSRVFSGDEPIAVQRRGIETFATHELAHAFLVGMAHDPVELRRVFARAADFLGLPEDLVTRAHGRVSFWRFARELLRSEQRVLGFYDATITGIDPFPDREAQEGPDPTFAGIERMFASGINHVLRSVIGIESERRYELLSMDVNRAWKNDEERHALEGPAGAMDDLRFAMSMNPDMKVLIAHGYYDMVTPYFSSERLVEQMKLLPEQREKLHIRHFSGGHMFYTWDDSRKAFRDWVKGFYG